MRAQRSPHSHTPKQDHGRNRNRGPDWANSSKPSSQQHTGIGAGLEIDQIVEVTGKVDRRNDQLQVIVEAISLDVEPFVPEPPHRRILLRIPRSDDYWRDVEILQQIDSILSEHGGTDQSRVRTGDSGQIDRHRETKTSAQSGMRTWPRNCKARSGWILLSHIQVSEPIAVYIMRCRASVRYTVCARMVKNDNDDVTFVGPEREPPGQPGQRLRMRNGRRHFVFSDASLDRDDAGQRFVVIDHHAHRGVATQKSAHLDGVVVVIDVSVIDEKICR